MQIAGFLPTTMLDYPGRLACTVFTRGCTLRCPFCQNAGLVVPEAYDPLIDEEEVIARIKKRSHILEGVCISGGEPTLQTDLRAFILRIRELGLPVKLDSNGLQPAVLRALLDEGLLDMIAMDVKAAPSAYDRLTGIAAPDTDKLAESVALIRSSGIAYEFRTTLVKGFHDEAQLRELAAWLGDVACYTLQSYEESEHVISPSECAAFSDAELEQLLEAVRETIPCAKLRYAQEK